MALTDESNGIPATMLVGPTSVGTQGAPYPMFMGNGGNGNGFGGDNGWWIVLVLILLFAAGGWNNNGNNGGGFGGGQPIIVNDGGGSNIQRGFDQSAIMNGIAGIQTGVQNLSTQLCGCCGDMQMAVANGFAGVEMGANARQIANMQSLFGIQSQIANGTNTTGAGLADLKYTVATENCADRQAVNEGVRDIIAAQTAGTQRILDKLCDQELQAERRENQNLRSELMYARGQASQVEQTAQIRDGQSNVANQLINELRSCPIPSQPVYGSQPIFTCPNNNSGCGCGCGSSF